MVTVFWNCPSLLLLERIVDEGGSVDPHAVVVIILVVTLSVRHTFAL